jgi:uncharacterized protein YecE (DUF72 family)
MQGVYIGTSGWSYESWRGPFYPDGLRRGGELEHLARVLDSVEINAAFYRLQKPSDYRRWYEQTPAGFVFALKGSRFITHHKKLLDVGTPIANYFASGVLLLREKLGPIVWQFPERQRFDEGRLAAFLALLPRDTEAAARLAAQHDHRLNGRCWIETDRKRPIRHALEVRHESFVSPRFVRLARDAGVAIVVSHAGGWAMYDEPTAPFVYLRLHGAPDTYGSRYEDGELGDWARRIESWRRGERSRDIASITERALPRHRTRDVYVYFDNDRYVHAPNDAVRLRRILDAVERPAAQRRSA